MRAKRIRIERGWIMKLPVLLLLLLSLMTPFAPAQILNYRNLVNRFITNYNKMSISGNLFRLLVLSVQPRANNDPAIPQTLNFTMMETVCPNTEKRNLDECDFKENGLVKTCYGTIPVGATPSSIEISCSEEAEAQRYEVTFPKVMYRVNGRTETEVISEVFHNSNYHDQGSVSKSIQSLKEKFLPEEIKSGDFLQQIIRGFANFIYQQYRNLLDNYTKLQNVYRKLQDIFSG